MSKRILLIITGFIGLVFIGTAVLLTSDSKSPEASVSTPSPSTTIDESNNPSSKTKGGGNYTSYSETALAADTGTKVLFFHAPWCSQCRQIESGINKDTVPNGVIVYKVDYDSSQDLRNRYGVTLQTTFIVLNQDNEALKKHVAYDNPDFESVKTAILQ